MRFFINFSVKRRHFWFFLYSIDFNYIIIISTTSHFFPIAFGIISHEQEIDFTTFFQTLLALCKDLHIQPVIKYIMQDACGSSANGAEATFGPNIVILMCYFHVIKNVKEYLKSIDEKIKTEVL